MKNTESIGFAISGVAVIWLGIVLLGIYFITMWWVWDTFSQWLWGG